MDFRILGTLEVRAPAGRPCPLPRRKERLLLAVLPLNANRACADGRAGAAVRPRHRDCLRRDRAGLSVRTRAYACDRSRRVVRRRRGGGRLAGHRTAQPGRRSGELRALCGLGRVHLGVGEPERALVLHLEALRLAVELGQPTDEARAFDGLYRASIALGESTGQARQWLAVVGAAVRILQWLGLAQVEEVELSTLRTEWSELARDTPVG